MTRDSAAACGRSRTQSHTLSTSQHHRLALLKANPPFQTVRKSCPHQHPQRRLLCRLNQRLRRWGREKPLEEDGAPGRTQSTRHDLRVMVHALTIDHAPKISKTISSPTQRECECWTHLQRRMRQPEQRNWGEGGHGGRPLTGQRAGPAVSTQGASQCRGYRLMRVDGAQISLWSPTLFADCGFGCRQQAIAFEMGFSRSKCGDGKMGK
jgi:hypothetical protein